MIVLTAILLDSVNMYIETFETVKKKLFYSKFEYTKIIKKPMYIGQKLKFV